MKALTIAVVLALSTGHVYAQDLGGMVERLARVGRTSSPTFSPDGRTLLFVSDRTDNYDIWRVGVNGSGLKRLTQSLDDDSAPDWSPNGSTIAYNSYHFASYDLYSMKSDGTGKRVLAKDLSDDVQPRWSPNGRSIAFIRTCEIPELCMKYANKSDGAGELYVLDAATRTQHRLKRTSAAESDPRWSPHGSVIAFVSTVATNSDIYTIRPNGSGLKRLTRSPGADTGPQWSPDGRRIVFMSVRDGNAEIYVMNADGSSQRNLTRNSADDSSPHWSRDGRRIFFVSTRDGDENPYAMNADGSGARRLAEITLGYGDLAASSRR